MNRSIFFASSLVVLLTVGGLDSAEADQKAAIENIEKLGGTVRHVAANDPSQEVDFHLSGKDLTDEGLASVGEVEGVIWLNLKDTKITDAGLKHLGKLKQLKKLHLERTAITDAGLDNLSGLSDLEYLNLYGTKVTDAGLEKLAGLKNLKQLYLWETEATEEGADRLKQAIPELVVNLGAELKPVKVEPVDEPDGEGGPAPKVALAEGQFLRVRHLGEGKILTLAEVEVIEKDTGKKLHTDGKASQSSVEYGAEASRAIDGNSEQSFGENSVTHTQQENYPWWVLDLGKMAPVGTIKVWNRSDCCGERLEGAIVELLDADRNVVWSEAIEGAKDGSVHEFANESPES
ncbi:MAG: hypothetical protein P8K78_09375 [Pirellulales bacterium]|nr:hypothetical protein [Pirellulales bacterium]